MFAQLLPALRILVILSALTGIISPLVFGYLIDRTGSWTLPFAGSILLLLLGAALAFRMHADKPFEPSRAVTVPA